MTAKKARKGKITHLGSAGPDDPIEKEGPQVSTPVPKLANSIPHRSWTKEDYKKLSGWQIGTFHRDSPPTAPTPDEASTCDMSDL